MSCSSTPSTRRARTGVDRPSRIPSARIDRFEQQALAWEDGEARSTVAIEWGPLCGIPTMGEAVYPRQLLEIVERLRARKWSYSALPFE